MAAIADYRTFLEIVHCGSISAAGRKLGLSPANVSAALARLEKSYQIRLLSRTTRSQQLTYEGEKFYQYCLAVADQETELINELTNQHELAGWISISCTQDFGRNILLPIINTFIANHPKIQINLHLTDQLSDLVREGIDLAIRLGPLKDSSMVARKLADNRRVLVASPKYLAKYNCPNTLNELSLHNCLTYSQSGERQTEWRFSNKGNPVSININATHTSSNGEVIKLLALAGKGIALKSIWDVTQEIKDGQLVTILDEFAAESGAVYAVFPNRKFVPQRVSVLIEHLKEVLENVM
ncbi:LysR family transcriptional regulator [Spartinivicinus poritis]|uniref:LysR family transcriptional regulator n=1 Tax=Spartinivicinus poritis TaxID=2994640 RepID=A0ABT5UE49_9GAMM|nr:LysR family transcriptional regulator [Spartinivicinus sp. A2-2]MDE1463797.1 LysR family transcriptional regulator [Spartinivicinus sp. A2-2]